MSHEGSVIAGRGWERPEMVGRTGQERKGSVSQCRARRDRVEHGRTQDFLKGGGAKLFPCIMASRHSDADGVQNWPDCIARKLMETE